MATSALSILDEWASSELATPRRQGVPRPLVSGVNWPRPAWWCCLAWSAASIQLLIGRTVVPDGNPGSSRWMRAGSAVSRAEQRPVRRDRGSGVLISEWPVGTSHDPFRFPLRNRILAALVEVLVVVESRHRGGSLITVREAADRSIDVMAVPGSVHYRASEGTNNLLADGAIAATETADVFLALALDHR